MDCFLPCLQTEFPASPIPDEVLEDISKKNPHQKQWTLCRQGPDDALEQDSTPPLWRKYGGAGALHSWPLCHMPPSTVIISLDSKTDCMTTPMWTFSKERYMIRTHVLHTLLLLTWVLPEIHKHVPFSPLNKTVLQSTHCNLLLRAQGSARQMGSHRISEILQQSVNATIYIQTLR